MSVFNFKLAFVLRTLSKPYASVVHYDSEHYFLDPNESNKKIKFPTLSDEPQIDLSVVVPSYNEEERRKEKEDESSNLVSFFSFWIQRKNPKKSTWIQDKIAILSDPFPFIK